MEKTRRFTIFELMCWTLFLAVHVQFTRWLTSSNVGALFLSSITALLIILSYCVRSSAYIRFSVALGMAFALLDLYMILSYPVTARPSHPAFFLLDFGVWMTVSVIWACGILAIRAGVRWLQGRIERS
jgi:hypothetical protein